MNQLPSSGFVRIAQIVGDKAKAIPPIIPVSRSNWWAGVKNGRYPQPVKLSQRITVWRIDDIRELIHSVKGGAV